MRILFIGKFPPIQGGVAAGAHCLVEQLLQAGLAIRLVSDCLCVESDYRIALTADDIDILCFRGTPWEARFDFDPVPPFGQHRKKIPSGLPTESLLYGRAARACRVQSFDFVLSNYLFPYGVVAAQVAKDFSIRHVVLHAGSDIFDLLHDDDLASTAREALSTAWAVLTVPNAIPNLVAIGLQPAQLRTDISTFTSGGSFYSGLQRETFVEYLSAVAELQGKNEGDPSVPISESGEHFTIGICGKAGNSKGTIELLDALAYLATVDSSVQCVAAWAGLEKSGLTDAVRNLAEVNLRTIAPLPRWRIPEFINFCDACLFLEHDFWLNEHTPQFPAEVLASGTPAIFSADVSARILPSGLRVLSPVTVVKSPMTWRHVAEAILEAKGRRPRGRDFNTKSELVYPQVSAVNLSDFLRSNE